MITEDGLLSGRVTYRQPAEGFRSGIEPILLAAAVPATSGQRVLEAGTGAGAALLCLHARVAGLDSVGVEVDPVMVRLAAMNATANGCAGMTVLAGAIEAVALPQDFDHALANPPYHPAGTTSPIAERETAKRGAPGLIEAWIDRLGHRLRHGGTLTLIVPTARLPACLDAMTDAACACNVLLPLWPMTGRPAKLVIVRGIRHSRAPMRLLPGLVLHRADGAFTEAAEVVLRDGAPLRLE